MYDLVGERMLCLVGLAWVVGAFGWGRSCCVGWGSGVVGLGIDGSGAAGVVDG